MERRVIFLFSGRQILKNTLLLTAAALLLRFASMLFQAHLAGRIGAEGLGAVQLLLSVFAFATTLGLAGMRVAASCLCAQAHGRREPAQVQLCLYSTFKPFGKIESHGEPTMQQNRRHLAIILTHDLISLL